MQLGMRQARYFGRPKTLFQLAMASAVANLVLMARAVLGLLAVIRAASRPILVRFCPFWVDITPMPTLPSLGNRASPTLSLAFRLPGS